jgi:purine nucleoside permease
VPAFESLHRAGSAVIHELLAHWSVYESAPPGK